jgi:RNA polymerase sigma-70 factor (ECF subfamily)
MDMLSSISIAFPTSATAESREAARRMDPARALIDRALSGDASAFREIFRAHRQDVARVVYRLLGPSPDVDDVVQEVFLHVYRSLPSFRGDSRFSTWLYRLAVNVTRMHLRKGRSRPRFADVDVPDVASEEDARRDDPESLSEQRLRVRALYDLLDKLGEKKREVIVLHDFEGMPAKEIAALVGAPVLTVRTRLFYARKELYAAMASEPLLEGVLAALNKATEVAETREENRPFGHSSRESQP